MIYKQVYCGFQLQKRIPPFICALFPFQTLLFALLLMKEYCAYHFISIHHSAMDPSSNYCYSGPYSVLTSLTHSIWQDFYHEQILLPLLCFL